MHAIMTNALYIKRETF